MKALTYIEQGNFKLMEKPKPVLQDFRDAIVRVPYADQGLNKIPDSVTDEQALFVGDVLATGFWAARISEIQPEDTVLMIGAGPTGICTLLCVMLKNPKKMIVCEKDEARRRFVREHYPQVLVCTPEECEKFVREQSENGGADVVLEVAGAKDTFAWRGNVLAPMPS